MASPPVSTALLAELAARVPTTGAVRASTEADVVDGLRPHLFVEPDTPAQVAAALAWAAERHFGVVVRGGGTKVAWGAVPESADLLISTTRLDRVVAHRHGDLTATVEAGATLAQVNGVLAQHGQWIPLDPPWAERATIGGVISTNDSGPARHRHGAPRDLIIGCTVVLADGQIAKSGGIVVKNVAGYDLARLLTGAFGSLGVIVSATFKLAPRGRHTRTASIEVGGAGAVAPLLAALAESPLTPVIVELQGPPSRIHVRFESVETSVVEQADALRELAAPFGSVSVLPAESETRFWRDYALRWDEAGTLVKVSTLPAALADTVSRLERRCAEHQVLVQFAGRALLGVVEVALDGDPEAQARVIDELRAEIPVGEGSVVLRAADRQLRAQVDPWGEIGDALPLMRRVKRQFDPDGRLNRGRGPGGI